MIQFIPKMPYVKMGKLNYLIVVKLSRLIFENHIEEFFEVIYGHIM